MAVVYEATHVELGHKVAIKVLEASLAQRPSALARFNQEARILATFRHPHVVTATDVGVWQERPYLVMELLEGETLAVHLRERGALPVHEIARIVLPVVSAVAAAHDRGVIHRDLKPSNVMLARRGAGGAHPMVLDFGIAKAKDESQAVTRDGVLVGTVAYLSPELTRSAANATARSDQYAVGVILYESATGMLPFGGEDTEEVLCAIASQDATPLHEARSRLPPAFDAVVARAMHRDPARRYPSMRALGRALLPFATERDRAIWSEELERGEEPEGSPTEAAGRATSAAPRTDARGTNAATRTDERALGYSRSVPRPFGGRRVAYASLLGLALASVLGVAIVAPRWGGPRAAVGAGASSSTAAPLPPAAAPAEAERATLTTAATATLPLTAASVATAPQRAVAAPTSPPPILPHPPPRASSLRPKTEPPSSAPSASGAPAAASARRSSVPDHGTNDAPIVE